MIDNLRASTDVEVDYLQIFRLSIQNGKQKIIHRQEEPVYCNEILVAFIWNPVENAKIFGEKCSFGSADSRVEIPSKISHASFSKDGMPWVL